MCIDVWFVFMFMYYMYLVGVFKRLDDGMRFFGVGVLVICKLLGGCYG